MLAIVVALVTERIVEPRLGPCDRASVEAARATTPPRSTPAAEAKGLRYALFAFLGFVALVLVLTLPPGAPLRDPVTGDIIGNTPFMDSLLFIIAMVVPGLGHRLRLGARDLQAAPTTSSRRSRRRSPASPGSSSCC